MRLLRYLFILSIILLAITNCCYSYPLTQTIHPQQLVQQIGFRLLNANGYEKRITFYYSSKQEPFVKISNRNKRITVSKGIFSYLDNEEELAAVISLGIAKLIDVQDGVFRRVAIGYSPRKYEVKADKKAVDLMVNAGYNPVALINIMNKTADEQNWFEYNIFSHNGSERSAYIYNYIYNKYPLFIAKNDYFTDDEYQNFLRTTINDRKKTRLIKELKVKKQTDNSTK